MQCVKEWHSFERHSQNRSKGGVPLLFIKRSDVGVALLFFCQGAGAERHSFSPLFFDLFLLFHKHMLMSKFIYS